MLKRHLTLIIKVDNPLRVIAPAATARDRIVAQFQYFSARSARHRPDFVDIAVADFFRFKKLLT
jgi:hypothetical protein